MLSPTEALATFALPPGFRLEIVASEPMISDPVAIDFDPDGRMYVVEMRGYMPNIEGTGEDRPVGRIVVLEDRDDDGEMDRRTVFMDSLVLPRAVRVTEQGVLVGAPPYLWLVRDVDGDLRADTREVMREDYGDPRSNPEHNANGLFWGIDNWIHNSDYAGQFRLRGGRLEYRATPAVGQWGVTSDDHGRLFRNANESPLHADLVPAHYFARNANLSSRRGVYERVIENGPVWPVRPTPGVNRGYQERTLRDDSTLAHFTAAGSPVVYRGDRLPADFRNNVFVTEPAGNLVRRFVVAETAEGGLTARNAYEEAEFLASTDERFRPVNAYSAPDGTLYVVDMYRGIIQHRRYITDYLAEQIRARALEQPVGMGRIYRVVHESTRRARRPELSRRSGAALVAALSHPNGWWRQTAQRLLVERADRSVIPALERLVLEAADDRVRLHAFWTLEGIGGLAERLVVAGLGDRSPHVRAAAVRVAEPYLGIADGPVRSAVLAKREDPSPVVRRHLAGALGSLPVAERVPALATLLTRYSGDPVLVDLAASGLAGHEPATVGLLLESAAPPPVEPLSVLLGAILQSGRTADLEAVLGMAAEDRRPKEQRDRLLAALEAALPRRGGRGAPARGITLDREPAALLSATRSPDPAVRQVAVKIADALTWPGKPRPAGSEEPPPLTPDEEARFRQGGEIYAGMCSGCHQPTGEGMQGVAKPLVGSPWALSRPGQVIRIVLHGKEGEMLMPPLGSSLGDAEVAAVLTYVRRSWGNVGTAITPEEVREVRGYTANRPRPWTEPELRAVR